MSKSTLKSILNVIGSQCKDLGPHLSTVRRKGSIFCPTNEI